MDNISNNLLNQLIDNNTNENNSSISIRENGKTLYRKVQKGVIIKDKENSSGFDMIIEKNTNGECIHIPVIITEGNLNETVYNNFYIKDNCNVTIIAGCGIHNESHEQSSHNGVHRFYIGKNCNVTYIEKHLGVGKNQNKILNPVTKILLGENSILTMNTHQLAGVNYAKRITTAKLKANSTMLINEKILTSQNEISKTNFKVELVGENSKVEVVSRSVAKDNSFQSFDSNLIGKNKCFGHVECDGILSDNAVITSTPKIVAKNVDAELVHEAAIGKISEEQAIKLMTLGLTKEEAEKKIVEGFLK